MRNPRIHLYFGSFLPPSCPPSSNLQDVEQGERRKHATRIQLPTQAPICEEGGGADEDGGEEVDPLVDASHQAG